MKTSLTEGEIELIRRIPKIGLVGYKGSGKTEIANTWRNEVPVFRGKRHSLSEFAFADPLKKSISVATAIPLEWFYDPLLKETPHPFLYGKTPREVMTLVGTEGYQQIVGKSIWVDTTFRNILVKTKDDLTPSIVFFSDTRFEHEADAILELGGVLVWVDNPNVGLRSEHSSETSVTALQKECSFIVENKGTLEDLKVAAKRTLEAIVNLI